MEYPSNTKSYNWLIHRIFQETFFRVCAKYLKGSLIDIGCGTKPYRDDLGKYVTSHVGVDHESTLHDKSSIDLFGTAYAIPVANENFDSAICTAVLEHLEEPQEALNECFRVLKPGGFAIYSVPFIWHLHEEPRDFYRYSKHGLRHLFQKAGFELHEIIPLSGFWVTFLQLMLYYFKRVDRGVVKALRLYAVFAWFVQHFAYFVHKYDRSYKWTWMYIVVAQKPGGKP